MQKSKRHHYVPAWYQKPFTRETKGQLYVYDKDAPSCPPRLQARVNTGVEKHLYSFQGPEGEHISLEEDFARLENIVQPILKHWQANGHRPTNDEIGVVALFVGHMLSRSPRTINAVAEIQEASFIGMMRGAAKNPALQAKAFPELKAQDKLPGIETVEQLNQLVEPFEERFNVSPDRKYAVAQSISVGLELGDHLAGMKWCILDAPSGEFFITSDCPVNLVHFPGRGKIVLGGGLVHPHAQVSFPLTPKVCVTIDHTTNQSRRRASTKLVRDLNKRQAAMAERFVYSHRETRRTQKILAHFAATRGTEKIDREQIIRRIEQDVDADLSN